MPMVVGTTMKRKLPSEISFGPILVGKERKKKAHLLVNSEREALTSYVYRHGNSPVCLFFFAFLGGSIMLNLFRKTYRAHYDSFSRAGGVCVCSGGEGSVHHSSPHNHILFVTCPPSSSTATPTTCPTTRTTRGGTTSAVTEKSRDTPSSVRAGKMTGQGIHLSFPLATFGPRKGWVRDDAILPAASIVGVIRWELECFFLHFSIASSAAISSLQSFERIVAPEKIHVGLSATVDLSRSALHVYTAITDARDVSATAAVSTLFFFRYGMNPANGHTTAPNRWVRLPRELLQRPPLRSLHLHGPS